MSAKWKLENRILNDALAVYYLLNQRKQIAQIVTHTMNTYEFMDQKLAVSYCFSPKSDVSLVEIVAENIQEEK